MTVAVVAEKPAVARDIAAVLGATRRQGGVLAGGGYVVTWAIGHLVGLAEPEQIDPAWRGWRLEALPMLPEEWPLAALPATAEQFEIVRRVLSDPRTERVVCATDAGREGELIFRWILRLAGCRKPVDRLWISSLTAAAIARGFAELRPSSEFDRLAAAAEARARADWLVGMNFTRAWSLRHGPELLSVGRVQTPTLALLVEREQAIASFVPEPYCRVLATFGQAGKDGYRAAWFDPRAARDDKDEAEARRGTADRGSGGRDQDAPKAEWLPGDGLLAGEIQARCLGREGELRSLTGRDRSLLPPLLYDLAELQRHANRLFGFTAQHTLGVAQALYERHKLITYPRTDSRHIGRDVAAHLPEIMAAIAPAYGDAVAEGSGERPLGRRYVDDARVTDHHAILPTGATSGRARLDRDEERLYDLVCRRLLMAWHEDHRTRVTRAVTVVAHADGLLDHFSASGTVVLQQGWKVLDLPARGPDAPGRRREGGQGDAGDGGERLARLPDGLAVGQRRAVSEVEVEHLLTRPPRRHTDATLLTAMETAGRTLADADLEEAMRERGLGTPATRAATLETLLARGYVERDGKALVATPKGIELIGLVHPSVKSPALTGEWELALHRMEHGCGDLETFTAAIGRYVVEVLGDLLGRPVGEGTAPSAGNAAPRLPGPRVTGPSRLAGRSAGSLPATRSPAEAPPPAARPVPPPAAPRTRPVPGEAAPDLEALLRDRFGLSSFRPHQEEVCRAVSGGEDALLVMPTGSGKSLCYQLPGVARGGTTLVISPLIALMEDQTARLRAQGFAAERIHSGRSREESRAVCRDYLAGRLDFLTIAPERLSVPGFPEMLARRPPVLVAVDEAHCISHWGHDFRPDYRLIGERLPLLRPSPVLALTATATVRVQQDILAQLGLPEARRFIRGFRRDNLAIEVVECKPGDRESRTAALLADPSRRPAIVYAPTRKMTDAVALALKMRFPAAAYHAGMEQQARARAQEAFLGGQVQVVVATVAFGMGIDKADIRTVVHLGLPGSLEAYYQEIGRAGRDGRPSRALLLYSFVDRRLHESFFARDYPEVHVLEGLLELLPSEGMPREELLAACGLDPAPAEAALVKLWGHGGITVDTNDVVHRGHDRWVEPYEALRRHREAQLDEVLDFARKGGCRMVRLIRHFGDVRDSHPCGLCDACAPESCRGRTFRAPSPREQAALERILRALAERDGLATGTIHRALYPDGEIPRPRLERWIDALERSGALTTTEESFEKEGKEIRFRRAWLSDDGRRTPTCAAAEARLEDEPLPTRTGKRSRRGSAAARPADAPTPAEAHRGPRTSPSTPGEESSESTPPKRLRGRSGTASPGGGPLFDRLREWRLAWAKRHRVPAFRVMPDRTLHAIVQACPRTLADLRAVPGVGDRIVEKHGADLLALLGE